MNPVSDASQKRPEITMILKTLFVAALMIAVGVYGYTSQDPNKASPTAAIPAAFGVVMAVCAVIAVSPSRRKHAMHAVAVLSLFGAIGSLYPVVKRAMQEKPIDLAEPAVQVSLVSSILCLILLIFCVRSFIAARKARRTLSANPF
jgi:hypothetical protein